MKKQLTEKEVCAIISENSDSLFDKMDVLSMICSFVQISIVQNYVTTYINEDSETVGDMELNHVMPYAGKNELNTLKKLNLLTVDCLKEMDNLNILYANGDDSYPIVSEEVYSKYMPLLIDSFNSMPFLPLN